MEARGLKIKGDRARFYDCLGEGSRAGLCPSTENRVCWGLGFRGLGVAVQGLPLGFH